MRHNPNTENGNLHSRLSDCYGFFYPIEKNLLLILLLSFLLAYCKKDRIKEQPGGDAPVAMAGSDTTLNISIRKLMLDGSRSYDPDGTIVSYHWSKISGPESFELKDQNTAKCTVSSLVAGTYRFELKVTDNSGLTARDSISITLVDIRPLNILPVADAGMDTTLTLSSCTAYADLTLDGSKSKDEDGEIIRYQWYRIVDAPLPVSNEVSFEANFAQAGRYIYVLEVTDDRYLTSSDTVTIHVVKPNVPKEYNLDIVLNDTFRFYNNYYYSDYFGDPYYHDVVQVDGISSTGPIGNFFFEIEEYDDTAVSSYLNATLFLQNQVNNFIGGDLNLSFKKLIQNGGGSFTSLMKAGYGSAQGCNQQIFNDGFNPVLLNVSGFLTIISRDNNGYKVTGMLTMYVKGKAVF